MITFDIVLVMVKFQKEKSHKMMITFVTNRLSYVHFYLFNKRCQLISLKTECYEKRSIRWNNTNADLSAKTESATSFAVHVLLSGDFIIFEFGGPI